MAEQLITRLMSESQEAALNGWLHERHLSHGDLGKPRIYNPKGNILIDTYMIGGAQMLQIQTDIFNRNRLNQVTYPSALQAGIEWAVFPEAIRQPSQ